MIFIIADPVLHWLWNIGGTLRQLPESSDLRLQISFSNIRMSFFLPTADFCNFLFGNTIKCLLNVEGVILKFPTRIVEL